MDSAGPFSRALFLWFQPVMRAGFRHPLQASDAIQLPKQLVSSTIRCQFQERLNAEQSWAKTHSKPPRVMRMLLRMNSTQMAWAVFCQLLSVGSKFGAVILLRIVVQVATRKEEERLVEGILASLGLLVMNMLEGIMSSQANFQFQLAVYAWMEAFAQAVLWKGTKLHPAVQDQNRRGSLVTLALSDLSRVVEMANIVMLGLGAPFMLIFAFISLILLIGPMVLAATVVCVVVFYLIKKIGQKNGTSFRGKMMWQGSRMSVLNEMLQSVRFTKYYTMEDHYQAQLLQKRAQESGQLKVMKLAIAFTWPTAALVPTCTFLAAFVMYVSVYGSLPPPEDAMAVLAVARFLFVPFAFLGSCMGSVNMLLTSAGRLGQLLSQPEITRVILDKADSDPIAVRLKGSFSWGLPASEERPTLPSLGLDVPRGELWVVVGGLGSGKSSLLSAILGDMSVVSKGEVDEQSAVKISGPSCAYVTQVPMVANATLRDNVTFGFSTSQGPEKFEARYEAALEAAALGPDLDVLPSGDQTEIGEKGITLSGGQKARVAVARAVMASLPGGLVLLDDPLAAVDAHVGAHLFNECIVKALAGTTRVLVTNQLQYLSHAEVSRILVMEDGEVVEQGTYAELTSDASSRFSKMTGSLGGAQAAPADAQAAAAETSSKQEVKALRNSIAPVSAPNGDGKLVKKEHKAEGNVGMKTFKFWINALGGWHVFVFLFFCSWWFHLAEMIPDCILVAWQEDALGLSQDTYFISWVAASLVFVFFMFLSRGVWVSHTLKASNRILRMMLSHVLNCPIGFFDQTPSGRIMNRFGEDQMICDFSLALQMEVFCIICWQLSDKVVLAMLAEPILAAIAPLLVAAFVFIREIHRRNSREMIRWWMVTKSPVFNAFEEILSGASTIFAFGQDSYFVRRFDEALETNLVWLLAKDASNLWVDIRLYCLSATVVACVSLLMVCLPDLSIGIPALGGISLVYSLEMGFHLRTLSFFTVQIEGSFASIERLQEFAENLPQEALREREQDKGLVEKGWPGRGCTLVFQNVCLRYLPHMPPALDDLSVSLQGREKIGLVGRTGSGKSTIMSALFRLVELESGQIFLGGQDIAKIGLGLLRKQITIVPQDPILFSGRLRRNLDPTDACDDATIWKALGRCSLESLAPESQGGLDVTVDEGGTNFSVGERQMISLVRALLRDAAVLCLDEATANVDPISDAKIQKVLANELDDCLVLTIAHRLHTVMHSDRILVLDRGRLVQCDSPRELLAQPGIFKELAAQAGLSSEDERLRSEGSHSEKHTELEIDAKTPKVTAPCKAEL
eukprot:TRINITY_DN8088_c0_g5_i1.p1 TRINITY_DN8088_c0_g5~~TRINITY_DN8088_c0_g5_i1.p1  ORF type:complete len:1305 (-),score=211.21 TRINITY_DN8088_c0_g5_i1:124-4038(-)